MSITSSAADGSSLAQDYRSMLSRQGGLNLEIKYPCARKTWHESEVGVFLKWTYFRETTVVFDILRQNDSDTKSVVDVNCNTVAQALSSFSKFW